MKSFALQTLGDIEAAGAWAPSGGFRREAEPADYCSRDGAQALKAKIESYWRERGQNVMLTLHNVGFHPAIRAARYDVRSDMVNGMPRSVLNAAQRDSCSISMVETDPDAEFIDEDEVYIAD